MKKDEKSLICYLFINIFLKGEDAAGRKHFFFQFIFVDTESSDDPTHGLSGRLLF